MEEVERRGKLRNIGRQFFLIFIPLISLSCLVFVYLFLLLTILISIFLVISCRYPERLRINPKIFGRIRKWGNQV